MNGRMKKKKLRGYERELQNLNRAKIRGGVWIDAGCGQGAYTLPLAILTDKVYAIDQNRAAIQILKSRLQQEELKNVECKQGNFNDSTIFLEKKIEGVLFAFSLHYQEKIDLLVEILQAQSTQEHFRIVILDYMRTEPVYWVPKPCPPSKILHMIENNSLYKAEINYQNGRYYILTIDKKTEKTT